MAYEHERKKAKLIGNDSPKQPYGFSTTPELIGLVEEFCKDTVLNRSEAVEVALVRLLDSWRLKKEHDKAEEIAGKSMPYGV